MERGTLSQPGLFGESGYLRLAKHSRLEGGRIAGKTALAKRSGPVVFLRSKDGIARTWSQHFIDAPVYAFFEERLRNAGVGRAARGREWRGWRGEWAATSVAAAVRDSFFPRSTPIGAITLCERWSRPGVSRRSRSAPSGKYEQEADGTASLPEGGSSRRSLGATDGSKNVLR